MFIRARKRLGVFYETMTPGKDCERSLGHPRDNERYLTGLGVQAEMLAMIHGKRRKREERQKREESVHLRQEKIAPRPALL
jgi:hypothetical protein